MGETQKLYPEEKKRKCTWLSMRILPYLCVSHLYLVLITSFHSSRSSDCHDAEKTREDAVLVKNLVLLLLYLNNNHHCHHLVFNTPHNLSLRDIVEEDEVTEHGDEADESQTSNNIDDRILKVEFS